MENPTPLHTSENPSYEDQVNASIQRHPAGKHHHHLLTPAPVLQASGAPKPIRNLKRVK